MRSANPDTKEHASAPVGQRCADCQIDSEACPRCYAVWWKRRHPNVEQLLSPVLSSPSAARLVSQPAVIAEIVKEMRSFAGPDSEWDQRDDTPKAILKWADRLAALRAQEGERS